MSAIRRFLLRLLSLVRSDRAETDLAREINAHLQLLEDDFRARGMSRRDARAAARRAFGGVEQVKEHQRDARSFRWLAGWPMDLKLGLRMLVKSPGLTVVGVIALSVAIGSGAAYLEFVNDMVRPTLPLPQADRIVSVLNWDAAQGEPDYQSLHDFTVWRERVRSIEHLGAYVPLERNLITDDGRAEPVNGVEISASAFRIAPTPPVLGRPLVEADEAAGAPAVIVIGHQVWQSRLAGAHDVIGRTVRLGRAEHTIVGVMPPEFGFPVRQTMWVPLRVNGTDLRRSEGPPTRIFGRLAPGVSTEAAQAELDTVSASIRAAAPDTNQQLRPRVGSYLDSRFASSEDRLQIIVLYSANAFFLGLLALCGANVATLVFARTAARQGEITVRTALGASRGRIVAQLFTEALVLSAIAAIAGLTGARYVGQWIKDSFLAAQEASSMPFWWNDDLGPTTIVYGVGLAVLAAAIAGVVPALKATGAQMQGRLKEAAGGGSTMKFGGLWTAVIVGQVAVTIVFLAGLMSLTWSLLADANAAKGFTFPAQEFLSATLQVDRENTPDNTSAAAQEAYRTRVNTTFAELEERLASDPTVRGVTYANTYPGRGYEFFLEIEGMPSQRSDDDPLWMRSAGVSPDYFETLGAPILAGRGFTHADVGQNVAVVDQTFVRLMLQGREPIGLRVRQPQTRERPAAGPWYEIVGVVRDLSTAGEKTGEDAILYRPIAAAEALPLRVLVRSGRDATSIAALTRRAAVETDPALRIYAVMGLDRIEDADIQAHRFFITALSIVAAVALMLATAGIYALMSFSLTRRTREIGIRIALGAAPRRILSSIFGRTFAQVALGVVIGSIPGSAVLGLGIADAGRGSMWLMVPGSIASAVFVLLVAAAACVPPARRALRIDPTEALRAGG